MAILLTETDTLILHIPKTAGMFVEYAVRTLGIQHVIPPAIGGQCPRHGTAENYAPAARVAAVIRHPARWIESWWRYHVGGPPDLSGFSYRFPYGDELFPIHRRAGDDFGRLVSLILDEAPGLVNRLFGLYTARAHVVMRYESLEGDLALLLNVPVTRIARMPWQNVSRPDRRPIWPPGTFQRWLEAEPYAT